jgi:hypothetical protein
MRQRLAVLEKDHRLLVDQVARITAAAGHLEEISAQLASIHRTLADADPQMAYDIITAVRDDVQSVLVEVTEQSNRAAAALVARVGEPSPSGQPQPGG